IIPMPGAEVPVDELGVSAPTADLAGPDGRCAALAQGPLHGIGDEVLSRVKMPVETAMRQPGFPHQLGDGKVVDAVAPDPSRGDVENSVMAGRLRRLRRTHDQSSRSAFELLTNKMISVILLWNVDDDHPLEIKPFDWRVPPTCAKSSDQSPSREAKPVTSQDATQPPSHLTTEVYTTPGRPIVSATEPGGPGDLPTWSPSSATLIYGDHDAILVDALTTYDQVDALANWIDTKGRLLSRISITHVHGDHWLGLARLIQRFPGATGLATAEVLARVEFEAGPGMAGYWEGIFPGEVPTGTDKVLDPES